MIRTLHALRFFFIMLIVFSHIIGSRFDFGGECGVSFFFVLSGFVLSLSYGSKIGQGQFSTRTFVARQLLKFYPLHLATLVAFVALDARLGLFYDWQHLVPSILLLQSWIPFDEYYFVANSPSWFLCDILFFYTLFAFSYRWLNRLSLSHLGVVCVTVAAGYFLLASSIPAASVNSILYAAPWTRLIDFCIGILLCRLYRSGLAAGLRSRLASRSVVVWEVFVTAVLIGSFFLYNSMEPRWRCAALFWFVTPPFLLFFALADGSKGIVVGLLHYPVMQWLGGISLEIYLLHILVFRLVDSLMASVGLDNRLLMVAAGLLVLAPVAWLVKVCFVDKVFHSLIKHIA